MILNIKPNHDRAYRLFHEGMLALSDAENYGIRIDLNFCTEQGNFLKQRIREREELLLQFKEVQEWKKIYGTKFNLESGDQLANLLFNHLGYKALTTTEKGNPKVDETALEELDIPFVKELLKYRGDIKLKSTYIDGLMREQVDGILHPFFNLHLVDTFRSSSDHPNFQNMPARDEEASQRIRGCFIPRNGDLLISIDYGGIEVKGSQWYHEDPVMAEYIHDEIHHPEHNMHTDAACDIYMLPVEEVSKKTRYSAKNGFTFPQFYGSWYKRCAKSLWDNIDKLDDHGSQGLKTESGMPLKKWLKSKGITSYEKFEEHIKQVEDSFWQKKFRVYTTWKEKWIENFIKRGFFCSLSGFTYRGNLSRNQIINYPIQGVAFHCLLWSMIELNKKMKQKGMRSRIVGQIHDEIIFNVKPDEKDDLITLAHITMCDTLRQEWGFISTHLNIDVEAAPRNASWDKMKVIAELRSTRID